MEANERRLIGHSMTANIATSILQVALCVLSYTALVALFLTQGIHIRSLTHVGEGDIPPAAVISVLAIILVGSTSVLVTRAVEHGLWATILRRNLDTEDDNPLTDDEVRRRAQWSVSPLARLTYIFRGRSWSMRLSGTLLLGAAALNPVLLYSVSPKQFSTFATIEVGASDLPFSGFTSASSAMYSADDAVTIGSLLHLKNVIVPSSSLCTQSDCTVEAHANTLQARCVATSETWKTPFLTNDVEYIGGPFAQQQHCSVFGEDTCVQMQSYPTNTHINFTSGPSTACGARLRAATARDLELNEMQCPPGDFAVLFGIWYSKSTQDSSASVTSKLWHTLDCEIQHGTIIVLQNGGGVPELDRNSFVKSSTALKVVGEPLTHDGFATSSPDFNKSAPFFWQMSYLLDVQYGLIGAVGMPLRFAVGDDRIEGSFSLAQALLGAPSSDELSYLPLRTNREDAEGVAKDVEAAFDTATLLAFAKAPHAASLNITTTVKTSRWAYNTKVLPILAVPLLATLLVCSVHWRVYGDEVVIGYDPVGIARRADEITAASVEKSEGSDGNDHTASLKSNGGEYESIK